MISIKNKVFTSITSIVPFLLFATSIFGQNKNDSLPKEDDFFKQWVDYSRPGKYHQLLGSLVGNWTFSGWHYTGNANPDSNKIEVRFNGTLQRKPFADGRYFIVNIHGAKIDMPLHNGKMKSANAEEITTEGYDNIKQKYVLTRITNHLGSSLFYSEGDYDSTTKEIIFQRVEALTAGVQMKTYEHLIFVNYDHYKVEIYREREHTLIKDTEINYVRVKEKRSGTPLR